MYFTIFFALLVGVSGDQKSSDYDWRIVGGSNATQEDFPYQISLQGNFGKHRCGGSIIGDSCILTAAHCVQIPFPQLQLKVVIGSTTLKPSGKSYGIESVRVHPKYDKLVIKNDVAVIILKDPIEFDGRIKKIDLQQEDFDEVRPVLLSGWGTTTYPGFVPNELQYIRLNTTTRKECRKKHPFPPVSESEICTFTKEGEGACHGDSGGPLVIKDENGIRQVGIVSWGRPCAVGYPDVFTRVSSFYKWIKSNCK